MLAFLEKAGPLTGVVGSVADWAISHLQSPTTRRPRKG
jgi:hypothetical protein